MTQEATLQAEMLPRNQGHPSSQKAVLHFVKLIGDTYLAVFQTVRVSRRELIGGDLGRCKAL
jgi:hypothetical protein